MSSMPRNREAAIKMLQELQNTLNETRKQADAAVDHFQQEKHRLIQMRTEADEQIREVKLQAENSISQLRQLMAKNQREYRRELDFMRRQWLGIEEAKPQNSLDLDSGSGLGEVTGPQSDGLN